MILLVLLAPTFLTLAALVLLLDGRPIFFRQTRVGLHQVPFTILKFRTMCLEAPEASGDESFRITRLGSVLRKTSLDELPSLLNVVRGDLSLVGPRPLLVEYLGIYTKTHSMRHAVRPGLTGLAQVAGRNLLSWKEKLDLDVVYLQRRSFWLDIKILLCTIVMVFSFRGIDQADGSTMVRLTADYDTE